MRTTSRAPRWRRSSATNPKNNYAGDPSVVGSTFWINTKPVTVVGIAPQGFYGDRLSSAPPEFYLPISQLEPIEMPSTSQFRFKMAVFRRRLKPGVNRTVLQQKLSGLLRQIYTPSENFSNARTKTFLPKTHVVLTDGGGGIQVMQNGYRNQLDLLMWISGLVLLTPAPTSPTCCSSAA